MFDFGLAELALIAVVAILVIGPKELPVIMVQVGRVFKRLNYVRYAISGQFDRFMAEAGLDDIKDQVNFEADAGLSKGDKPSPLDAHSQALDVIEKPIVKKKAAVKKKAPAKKAPAKKVAAKKAPVKKPRAKDKAVVDG